MRIDTNLNPSYAQANAGSQAVKNIRVSFDPVTKADMTLAGMTQYQQRQLGLGGNVNVLV